MDGAVEDIASIDWNEAWKKLQAKRKRADDARAWDERAKDFPVKHGKQTEYVTRFLELAGVRAGESVLDMGCGTGALATPLAQAGHEVFAADFSRGMLGAMEADQRALGVRGVHALHMSWADDWEAHGLSEGSVDVALASRSIATDDLGEALLKLERTARRRCCITLPCGPSPRIDERLLEAAGFARRLGRDFLYAFNILASRGRNPEVSYIPSSRFESFASPEEALSGFSKIVRDAVQDFSTSDERARIEENLAPWLEENLVQDGQCWRLRDARRITWAFLAWPPA